MKRLLIAFLVCLFARASSVTGDVVPAGIPSVTAPSNGWFSTSWLPSWHPSMPDLSYLKNNINWRQASSIAAALGLGAAGAWYLYKKYRLPFDQEMEQRMQRIKRSVDEVCRIDNLSRFLNELVLETTGWTSDDYLLLRESGKNKTLAKHIVKLFKAIPEITEDTLLKRGLLSKFVIDTPNRMQLVYELGQLSRPAMLETMSKRPITLQSATR